MYTIEKLSDILGYSEHQVRRRLDQFSDVIRAYIRRADKNKILVDSNGLEILKRAKEIEQSGSTITQALNKVKQELHSSETELHRKVDTTVEEGSYSLGANQGDGSREAANLLERQIQMLTEQMATMRQDYKEQLQSKEQEIERLYDIITLRLPPARDSQEGISAKVSRWKRLKQFVKGE